MAFFDDLKEVIHEAKGLFPDENTQAGKADDSESKTVYLKCPYCGAENKVIWREGTLPKCPYCGGEYDSRQVEEQKKAMLEAATKRKEAEAARQAAMNASAKAALQGPWARKHRIHIIMIAVLLVMAVAAAIYGALGGKSMSMRMDSSFEVHVGDAPQPLSEDEADGGDEQAVSYSDLYVEELDRECVWDDENQWWYDVETDCYLMYNESGDPAVWQYWVKDISGNYGDYGWLYFAETEGSWYVQTDADTWEPLPKKYDTSALWQVDADTVPEEAE